MEQCKLCGRRGLFLSLDDNGYCPACVELRTREAKQKWDEIAGIPEYKITLSDLPRKRRSGYYTMNIHFSNITPRGNYNNIVVFDTETTGLVPYSDRIIQIAAVKFLKGHPVERFHSYVKPHHKISEGAQAVNGITDDMLANAPTIDQLLPAFEDFVGTSILVAHNLNFDLHFLYYSGSIVMGEKRRYIDTLQQARKHLKKSADVSDYKLGTLCEYYGITIAQQHNALADAYATGELFFKLANDIAERSRYSVAVSSNEPEKDVSSEYTPEPLPQPRPEPKSKTVQESNSEPGLEPSPKPGTNKKSNVLVVAYRFSQIVACIFAAFSLLMVIGSIMTSFTAGIFIFLISTALLLWAVIACNKRIKQLQISSTASQSKEQENAG